MKRFLRQKPEYVVFGIFFLLLTLKFLLITNLSNDHFLSTFKFTSSDSFDWIANGLRLFQNDTISFRNPGLPVIIRLLNIVGLLPLIVWLNQMVFWALGVFVYKICRLFGSKLVSLVLAVAVLMNFMFNQGANFILSDFYAVLFITAALYFLLKKRWWLSFFMLGCSLLFQNFAFFLMPVWLIVILDAERGAAIQIYKRKDFLKILQIGGLLVAAFLPFVLWAVYKFIKFGSPLYTKLDYFSLLKPNLNSVVFYSLNAIVVFGIILVPLVIFLIWNFKRSLKQRGQLILLAGLAINTVFWIIFYDWNDRRFLLYFIPWIYPLVALMVSKWKMRRVYLVLLLALLYYPTILPSGTFFTDTNIPLVHNTYLDYAYTETGAAVDFQVSYSSGFEPAVMDIDPTLFQAITRSGYYRSSESNRYSFYQNYLKNNFNLEQKSICWDTNSGLRTYVANSILLIDYNFTLNDLSIHNDNCVVE